MVLCGFLSVCITASHSIVLDICEDHVYVEVVGDHRVHHVLTHSFPARRSSDLSSDKPAILFGSSSGGIIVLEVLARHPSVVRTLVPHEPAAVRLLPDGQKRVDFFFAVYDLYRQSGIEPALTKFRAGAFSGSDRQALAHGPRGDRQSVG